MAFPLPTRRPAMGRRFACSLLLLSLLAPAASAQPPDSLEAFADSLLSAQIAKYAIPGAVLAVVRDGRVAFVHGYGYANAEKHTAVDPERTTFRVASVSKLVTATAAMQMVDRGKLDLHADVNSYLKQFQVPRTYAKPITLFDLLTHTSGFDERYLARKTWTPAQLEPLGDFLARDLPPRVRPPGEFIAYSNHGYALVGHLVELAAGGTSYAEVVRANLLDPLGMMHSGFGTSSPAADAVPATGYNGDPPRPQRRDYTRTIPASMFSSTGADMARFMAAHLNDGVLDGHRVLGESLAVAMKQRQFSQDSRLAGVCFGFWEIERNGVRGIWHDGDAAGFASLLYLAPSRRTGFFMAFNSRAGGAARGEILRALIGHEFPPVPRSTPAAAVAGDARRYAGTWVDMRSAHRTLEKIASLQRMRTVKAVRGGALIMDDMRYLPIGPNLFEGADGRGRIGFRVDSRGNVTHLFDSRSLAHVYERVPWYGTVPVQIGWLATCVLGFLIPLVAVATAAIVRGIRRSPTAAMNPAQRWTRRAAFIAAVANLVFIAGFSCVMLGVFGGLEYGIPPLLYGLLALPWIAIALALVAMIRFVSARRQGQWTGAALPTGLAIAASLAFVPWLAYWNLLGYRL